MEPSLDEGKNFHKGFSGGISERNNESRSPGGTIHRCRRKREGGEEDSGRAASGGEKKEKGRGKTRRRVTILLSFLYPQKSRFSAGASNNERTEPSLSPYTLLLRCHFRLVYFSISPVYVCVCMCVRLDQPVRQSPSTRKKQLKRLKSPKARREAKRDRKPCEFFAGCSSPFFYLLPALCLHLHRLGPRTGARRRDVGGWDIATRAGIAPGNCTGI